MKLLEKLVVVRYTESVVYGVDDILLCSFVCIGTVGGIGILKLSARVTYSHRCRKHDCLYERSKVGAEGVGIVDCLLVSGERLENVHVCALNGNGELGGYLEPASFAELGERSLPFIGARLQLSRERQKSAEGPMTFW